MKILVIFLTFIIIYLTFLLLESSPYNGDSFGGKIEIANLQNIRDGMGKEKILNKRLSLITFKSSEVLLIDSNITKCGILLNCEYPPYYKEFGNCKNIILTSNELNIIKNNTKLPITVRNVLFLKMR